MTFKWLSRVLVSGVVLGICILSSIPVLAQSTCSKMSELKLQNGLYNFQMNENDSSLQECAKINGVGFTITNANFANATNGSAAAYTSVYRGCHWGSCTVSNPFPIQVSNLASAESSLKLTQPTGYNNDAAYDIWFNQKPRAAGQPDGAEVMIWLNHQGTIQPFGSRTATATIEGEQYEVWTGKQSSWKIVSYVASRPVTAVKGLNLMPFFADAVARGSVAPSWWLIDVEFGFEIWTGGMGLAVSEFGVNAAARAETRSAAPVLAGNAQTGGVSCHVGYSIVDQWAGGFKAAITIENTGPRDWSDWTLKWTFANGQTITNLWNGTASQSGASVTVQDKDYNRTIGAGSSYSGLGLTGNFNSVTNTVPGSFYVNGAACD